MATSRSPSSGRCTRACDRDRSAPQGWKSSCRPARSRAGSATATPCSSRSRCGARCCRATASCSCTAGSSCRPTPARAREAFVRYRGRHHPRAGPRLRPGVVAAGRSAVGAAGGRAVGVGRRAAGAGDAVEAPARDARRRRPGSDHPARGAPSAGAGLSAWDWFDGGFFEFWR